MTDEKRAIGDFLIARGGPFYELQRRLGLLREDSFRAGSRALLFVGLAWGVPLVLSAIMRIWLALVLLLFALPLSAFGRPLKELKMHTLLASSAQATRHFRAVERDVLGQNVSATADAESTKAADNPDPSKIFGAAQKCSTLPFSREAWLPISVAALAPLIAAGATQLPVKELITVAKRLLLL
jgi:hypothetical protein